MNISKSTVSAHLVCVSEFRISSAIARQQTRWDLFSNVTPNKSFSRNLVRVLYFRIHSCFRTEFHLRNLQTPISKLALMEIVYTPVTRVWNRWGKREKFFKSERNLNLQYFCGVRLSLWIRQKRNCLKLFCSARAKLRLRQKMKLSSDIFVKFEQICKENRK